MKQEVKAFLDTVAGRRAQQVQRQDSAVKANYALDDQSPRAVVKAERDGKVTAFEFIETSQTAAVHANMEDYVFAANEFGTVSIALPESDYTPAIAVTILGDLRGRIVKGGATREFTFAGYLYDGMGNFRKLL
ncbi:MAG: hypothetical protein SA339_00805 [Methanomassiliicoccus sp.]|nr:hypothetical protein [Methanomassiliicoccus sp.]